MKVARVQIQCSILLLVLTAVAVEGSPLPCDSTITATIESPSTRHSYSFNVFDGERVSISVVTVSGVDFDAAWRILDSGDNPVSGLCGVFGIGDGFPNYVCDALVSSGNPYRIEIGDHDANATGTYRVHMQSPSCPSVTIDCDTTLTFTTDDDLDTDLFRFDVVENEHVSVTVATISGTSFESGWRVIDSDGQLLSGACGNFGKTDPFPHYICGPLTQDRSPYFIEIGDATSEGTGTYSVHLQRPGCQSTMLPCDSVVADSIETRVDSDLYKFDVGFNERVAVSVVTESWPSLVTGWRVLDSSGKAVPGACGKLGGAGQTRWECVLPASANPYMLEIADSTATGTGTYKVHLQRLAAFPSCKQTELICDGSRSIGDRLDTDLYVIDFNDAKTVTVQKTSGPADFQPYWRVVDASGVSVGGACGIPTPGDDFPGYSCGPFSPEGAPYRLEVWDNNSDAQGTYSLAIGGCVVTSVPGEGHSLPRSFGLMQNYPNPFNPTTVIGLELPVTTAYRLSIHDVAGRLVREFVGADGPGTVSVIWDGTDTSGRAVGTGLYYYKAAAGNFVSTRKMVLLK